jgi:hypothetical protein
MAEAVRIITVKISVKRTVVFFIGFSWSDIKAHCHYRKNSPADQNKSGGTDLFFPVFFRAGLKSGSVFWG